MSKKHLVLLPGWGMEKEVFLPLTHLLEPLFHFNFIDWQDIISGTNLEERVGSLLNDKTKEVYLLGWSMGSIAAINIATKHKNIDGLILVGGTSRFTIMDNYLSGWNPRIVERMKRQLRRDKGRTLQAFYHSMFSVHEHEMGEYDKFLRLCIAGALDNDLNTLIKGLDYLIEQDVREQLASIDVPSLLIHGVEDNICPVEASKYIHTKITNSILHILHHSGHIPFFTEKETCANLIKEFIEERERR
ncbi:alpha/beta hydrolase [Cytobacillus sp. IB215316]|uniref:alpha/beta fold hydrolase n=1 Tax=Cytobacillus sp. IB215316 TaxID=3097354 RepID=UPI002A13A539|nr:alpha/beta hydrolase [Cytobacillus sp. IB215316]MDX8360290.1 alpha/beta hydrolase [Cytobacillus sp. IB215316]